MTDEATITKIAAGYRAYTGRNFPGIQWIGHNVRAAWISAAHAAIAGKDAAGTYSAYRGMDGMAKGAAFRSWISVHKAMAAA